MSAMPDLSDAQIKAALSSLDQARAEGLLEPTSVENLRLWLSEPRYRAYVAEVVDHLEQRKWSILNDVFWKVIPFGTAGRRGRMYPIGTNAINDRTIGESAQGLADYLRASHPGDRELRCAVAYDTRHRSREFAELSAEIMAAAGFVVYFLDGPRSTPELAFTVRHHRCHAGIVISASHNPPSDNAIKVFGPSGGQLRPPHDVGVMRAVGQVHEIARIPFADALARGRILTCQAQMDGAYQRAVLAHALPGPREANLLFSPLHGVGASSVLPVLVADGFARVEIHQPHASPDGDFPNVPDHVANPENPAVFEPLIASGRRQGAVLVLASDPDADRIGCAAPDAGGRSWHVFSGNQIAALLADFILRKRRDAGTLRASQYLVKTLVTSDILRRLAESYGIRAIGDVLTGFKWIGGVIDELGANDFLFAAEEAHGYLVGDYVRDKDAAGAAMLLAELAADCLSRGETLCDALESVYQRVGYHAERTVSRVLGGAAGMSRMQAIMAALRDAPPKSLGDMQVVRRRDYFRDEGIRPRLVPPGPAPPDCDLLFFDLDREGYSAAVRPSGTEPKLKFYFFAYEPPRHDARSEAARDETNRRLAAVERDLLAAADAAR
jgi:phosphomannomutase